MTSRSMLTLLVLLLFGLVTPTICPADEQTDEQSDEQADQFVELIVELLGDPDKEVRALALEQIRDAAAGAELTGKFAAQLPRISAEAQVGLLRALADRGDRAARQAVLELMDDTDQPRVAAAAIRALGKLGTVDDVRFLQQHVTNPAEIYRTAARDSLIRLSGPDISAAIALAMDRANPARRIALIDVLAVRRATDAIPNLLAAAVDEPPEVRTAAMAALGKLADPEHVPGMVRGLLAALPGRERAEAEKNIMFVCNRIADPQRSARPLLDAMEELEAADRLTLLSTVGRVGGNEALAVIEQEIRSRDPQRHSAAIRAISNWPNASVASRLIEIALTDPHSGHRTTALRAAIRVAALPDERSDQQRLKLLRRTMEMSSRVDERVLVLQRARAVRIPETLKFVLPYVDDEVLSEQACETIVELAHHRELRESNREEFHRALDQVIAVSDDAVVVDRAKRYKRNQTWVRPK